MTRIETLGPFCWLLQDYICKNKNRENRILYRGATLKQEMIDEYRQAVGTKILWLSFVSTSKVREVAEFFSGNTLFIIEMKDMYTSLCTDITSLSLYPDEEEVLLMAQFRFRIDNVELDSTTKKYSIYLSSASLERRTMNKSD